MAIFVNCTGCGKRLKAKESQAGRVLPCPQCGEKLRIPRSEQEPLAGEAAAESPVPAERSKPASTAEHPGGSVRPVRPATRPRKSTASISPLSSNETPLWLRHLHWFLILALFPLALSLLQSRDETEDFATRLDQTLQTATPEQTERVILAIERIEAGNGEIETLFEALPEHRLTGAFLPRESNAHWGMATGATLLFLVFFVVLAARGTAAPLHLLIIGLLTATIGVVLLLLFQALADWSQSFFVTGRSILVLLFYVVKFIGFSYRAALDPDNGFLLSFLGYTFGVGLCEEVVKALPVLFFHRTADRQGWHGAFLWGLASGAGFGIAEGIMYAGNYYNGIHGGDIYVVRFISCVALHAVWTGSVAITFQQNQGLFQGEQEWYEYIPSLFIIIGVPMVLHGLYDTLLKKEMNGWALAIALLSFVYLAFLVSRLHGEDADTAKEEFLQEYQRRRKQLA
ncbi:MAG: PrsW family glutamic-type intramembrane protease [Planctomycetales bacterium]